MYVERIRIENVRGFGEGASPLELDRGRGRFEGWTVIAGRNGAGKTTLLRAIALAILGRAKIPWLQHDFSDWVRAGAEDEARIFVGLRSHAEDSFQGRGARSPQLGLHLFWSAPTSKGHAPHLEVREVAGGKGRTEVGSRGPWAEGAAGWFVAGYGPFRRLSGHATEAQRAMSGPAPIARTVTLFREDASLLEALQWLRDLHLRALEGDGDAEDTRDAVFALLDDGLLPDPDLRVDHYDADGLWVKRGEAEPLRLASLSDGYRAVAALALDLLRSLVGAFGTSPIKITESGIGRAKRRHFVANYRGVVLIDEVDAHLHVSWQQRIGPWLKARFPHLQFIVSTHSPFICQAADESGLILLPAPGEEGHPRVADEELRQRVINGGVDAALLSELFGLEHTWSEHAEAKREELARLELKVLDGTASRHEQAKYRKLREEIPETMAEEVERVSRSAVGPARRVRG